MWSGVTPVSFKINQLLPMKNNQAVLIVAHGSRSKDAILEFNKVIELVRAKLPSKTVYGAHMEINDPNIPTGIKYLAESGATEITVVPYFLFMGNHSKHDIPDIVNGEKHLYPTITFKIGKPFGVDSLIADLLLKRIEECDK